MTFRENIEDLRIRILRIVIAITVLTIFSITFRFRPFEFNGVHFVFYYRYLDIFHNFAIQITSSMQAMLLSPGKLSCSATCFNVDWYNDLRTDNYQVDICLFPLHLTNNQREQE